MRRTILAFAVVPLVLAFAVQPAAAGPPEPVEFHEVWDGCGFPVQIDVVGMIVGHEWTDKDGNFRYIENAMGVPATATNPATEESITVMYTGALFYTEAPDGSWTQRATGPWVWYYDPATFEEPGLWYTTGRLAWSGVGDVVMSFSGAGQVIDLCPLLAS